MSLSIVHKNKEKKHLNILLKTYITKIRNDKGLIFLVRCCIKINSQFNIISFNISFI